MNQTFVYKGAWKQALFLVIGSLILQGNAMASNIKRLSCDGPPLSYLIKDVNITLSRHLTSGKGKKTEIVNIVADGKSTVSMNGNESVLTYSRNDVLEIINSLYAIKFFDLPSRYSMTYSVFMNADGLIDTSANLMQDQASTNVCFSISTYKKCVAYGVNKPEKLDKIVTRILTTAETLSEQPKVN